MRAPWPLVGRAEELTAVTAALAEGRSVVVAGAAGVGKSRLAREATAALGHGSTPRWAVATHSASGIPLGALAPLLARFAPPDERDRAAFLRRAADALVDGGPGRPVAVDDAHLLDDLSATLLHQLALEGRTPLLLTVRSHEPCPDAVVSLWKEGVAERVEVQALSRDDVDELVRAASDGPVSLDARDRLWALSEGNPLFLTELLAGGRELGFLRQRDGRLSWHGPVQPTARLSELIEARLQDLATADREALEVLAVAENLPVPLLAGLAPAARLDGLERRGLLAVERSGHRLEAHLAHPLHGEVLRAAGGELRHRELARRLADAIQAAGGRRRDDVLRIASWRLEAGVAPDAGIAVAAAEAANALLDHELAERVARAALAAHDDFAARLALAVALVGQGRAEEGEAELGRLAAEADTDERRWAVAAQRVQGLVFQLGRVAEAEELLLHAEGEVGDAATVDLLRAERAHVLVNVGRIGEALALTAPIVDGGAGEAARLRALRAHGMALALSGQAEAALELALEALAPRRRAGETETRAPAWAAMVAAVALVSLGRFRELADRLAQPPGETGQGPVDRRAYLHLLRGRVALLRGRPRTAAVLLEEAAGLLRTAPHGRLPWGLGLLAEAKALAGEVEAAEAAWAEAASLLAPGVRQFEHDVRHAGIWVRAAAGELSAAIEEASGLAERCRASGALAYEAFALHAATRLGAAAETAERLHELATMADGRLVPAFAAHATALVADDGGALLEVAGCFEELGADLHAAEAAVQGAAAHTRAGLRAAASTSWRRAEVLTARCEGARTPALAAAARAPVPLTRREREVATLAARGLSSSAIAEKLVVSVRTVEGHLYNAFTKLRVSRREDLADLLGEEHAAG